MRRAITFVALAALAWAAWDTGADPMRLMRGLPWLLDFLRRMLPPDVRVLPAALAGAFTTVEIALLGTGVAAVLRCRSVYPARNSPRRRLYPARAALNFFRSVDTSSTRSSSCRGRAGAFPGRAGRHRLHHDVAGEAVLGGHRGHRARPRDAITVTAPRDCKS